MNRATRRFLESRDRKAAEAIRQGKRQRAIGERRIAASLPPPPPPVRLIYSAALGTLRRGIIFTTYEEMADPALNAGPGELQIDIPRERYDAIGGAARAGGQAGPAALQSIINRHTGRDAIKGVHDRFAVVDEDGMVIGALLGDPACGFEGALLGDSESGHRVVSHRMHRFVHHPEAEHGWVFHEQRGFTAPPRADDNETN